MEYAQLFERDILIGMQSLASNTTTTARLDIAGSEYVTLEIAFGAELNTNATGPAISLKESDDTVVTNFATFNASFNRTAEDCTASKVVAYHIDPKPRKRYLRLELTTPNSTNDVVIGGCIYNLLKDSSPTSTAVMGDVCVIG